MGKKVITIDLNPLSRTAKAAHVAIVDNVTRAMPALVDSVASLKGRSSLRKIAEGFDNDSNLSQSLNLIKEGI
jgi:4-phosphopantoate--beta-alanine ligase